MDDPKEKEVDDQEAIALLCTAVGALIVAVVGFFVLAFIAARFLDVVEAFR